MARKKTRSGKDQKAPKGQDVKAPPVPARDATGASRAADSSNGGTNRQKESASGTGKSGISIATAVAGMILTLVLGLYIGSLLPSLFLERKASAPQVASAPPPARMSAATDNLDPRLRQSIADLEKKAASAPSSPPDWINLGNAYFDGHLPQKAIEAYEHALTLAPDNPDVLTDLGIMYREIGRYEKAVECFRKAVAIDPGHQNALFNAGVVLDHDLKLKAEAAAMWEQLLSLNPQAQAPNGVPVSEMVRNLRQQTNHPGVADKL